ncbi:TPA: helix-turn-helix transcriptional regulator, partial [Escherichia coli]|nr:helix-turn-helix transcriptional regulator [Escherichia coli]
MKNVKNTENRIAAMLKAKGWTQAQLARKLGVSAQSVQYWTTGKTFPRSDKLAQLSEISGYPQSWFLGEDPSPTFSSPEKHQTRTDSVVFNVL